METQGDEPVTAPRPAGWYRDPAPANPAFPTTVRWWDGTGWTGQTRPAKKAERQSWQHELAAEQHARAVAQAEQLAKTYTPEQLAALADVRSRDVTADGQPLAGWWRRFTAALLDSLATSVIALAFGWPFIRRMMDAFSQYVQLLEDASRNGSPTPDSTSFAHAIDHATNGLVVVSLIVSVLYHVGFLKAFGATPGKMLLGIEVRLVRGPGVLPWRTVLLRWLFRFGPALLTLVPLLGLVYSLYWLLNGLWPLWDPRRQAIHDHVAGTQVCRR
jgi:uncharacterized RDD family membrane protein YckC